MDESRKLKSDQKITTDVIGRTHEAEMYQEKQDSKNSETCDSPFLGPLFLDPFWAKRLFNYLIYTLYVPTSATTVEWSKSVMYKYLSVDQ